MTQFNGRKALVVEDQEMFREAIAFELREMGFDVTAANDGKAGFESAMAASFDLIVSDIRMPNWDGVRFLREFRQASRSAPPFVFMSGFADISVEDAYGCGADAYLGKPVNSEKLHAVIERLLLAPAARWAGDSQAGASVLISKTLNGWDTPVFREQCAIGRGGLSLSLDQQTATIKVGERVGFDLDFTDGPLIGKLVGTGIVIWKKNAVDGRPPAAGIQFEFIEEPGRSALIGHLESACPAAAIPAGAPLAAGRI